MRVATFNVHHGTVGRRGRVDPEQLAAVCAAFDADVLALQEVDQSTVRVRGADLARIVADACGMAHVFGSSRWFLGGSYGNAVLVRGAIERSEIVRLPRVPASRWWQERRTLLEVEATVEGRPLWIGATHLAVPPATNGPQLAVALGRATAQPRPAVVLGDLNRRLAPVREEATAAGLVAAAHGPTFPAHAPNQAIDHVLTSSELQAVGAEVRSTTMSDHAALLVDLEWVGPVPGPTGAG